jgi:hypothetical protein
VSNYWTRQRSNNERLAGRLTAVLFFARKRLQFSRENIFPAQKYIFFALDEKYLFRYTDRAIIL